MLDTIHDFHIERKIESAAIASLESLVEEKRKRHEEKLSDYLNLGRFLSKAKPAFNNNKPFGQFIASVLPKSQELQSSLKSDAKWLYEALHKPGSPGGDILKVLELEDMANFKSANPSVIREEYRCALRLKEKSLALTAKIDPNSSKKSKQPIGGAAEPAQNEEQNVEKLLGSKPARKLPPRQTK